MLVLAVESHQLLEVIWVSFVACIAVSVLFSLVIVGAARAGDARKAGHALAAAPWFLLAVVCFTLFAGGVVLGVHAMIQR
jgi:Na+/H+-dicarboxylate symporter